MFFSELCLLKLCGFLQIVFRTYWVYQRWVIHNILVSDFLKIVLSVPELRVESSVGSPLLSVEVDETSHVGAYGVGISNEILKPERVMPVEELGSSSCQLHAKYKPQILFLKGECSLHYPFQKWPFAPTSRQSASSCCPLCCNGCCLYMSICFCELVYF